MRACEHCQFGSSAKRALAILVARNSNWHILGQVSVLADVSGTRRGLQSAGNAIRSRSWLQNFIDALLTVSNCTVLLLITGDSVTEELFYYLANGEAFDACDGFNLDHDLHGTDEREVLPGFSDDTVLFWCLLLLRLRLLCWLRLLSDVLDTTFKVCQTTGIHLLTHTRLHINLFYNGIEGMFDGSLFALLHLVCTVLRRVDAVGQEHQFDVLHLPDDLDEDTCGIDGVEVVGDRNHSQIRSLIQQIEVLAMASGKAEREALSVPGMSKRTMPSNFFASTIEDCRLWRSVVSMVLTSQGTDTSGFAASSLSL